MGRESSGISDPGLPGGMTYKDISRTDLTANPSGPFHPNRFRWHSTPGGRFI